MKTMSGMVVLASLLMASGLQTALDWENPERVGLNKTPGHSTLLPYATDAQALSRDPGKSPSYKLLNGDWKFAWSPRPADRPMEFYTTEFDDSAWGTISMHLCGTNSVMNMVTGLCLYVLYDAV